MLVIALSIYQLYYQYTRMSIINQILLAMYCSIQQRATAVEIPHRRFGEWDQL